MKEGTVAAITGFLSCSIVNWIIIICVPRMALGFAWIFANFIALTVNLILFRHSFDIALRASLLGCVNGGGMTLLLMHSRHDYRAFGIYLMLFTFFHWSEFTCIALSNPRSLTIDSFLLNHSIEYWLAAGLSWAEFWFGFYFWPGFKSFGFVSALGLLLCIIGESLRKAAILTAKSGFTHLVSHRKRPDHELITTGVYSLFRHPSYVGWFWWSVGTQMVLCNPICVVGYAVAAWRFFKHRIYEEELSLISFFAEDYLKYQKLVPTGLPFIEGFKDYYD